MKIDKGKYLTYSIGFLIFGWLYYLLINYLNYIDFSGQFIEGILSPTARKGKYDTIWFKLIAIGFGAISIYLSYKIIPPNQNKLRITLISLSILLLIMSIVAFPNLIWYYLI
ncbi:hypothetical protein RBU60_14125 [Mesonia sp. MT50]|uniref:DUF5658 domain-containing protein n=1 Tax=Mesonia profundi TaxID=3070998 RepID=A0ABU1A4T0_9FLAO|nr:hypothetical protein [Mesonia profundi]MDQ7918707.1 hypothetical protein [Mesonia profundi]